MTGRPVLETFSVADVSTIALERLEFDEFGPNLPAGADQVGAHATFTRTGATYRVDHHSHPVGTVPLLAGGQEVDHVLVFEDGQRLRLLDIVDPGARVELGVERTSTTGPGDG